MECKGECGAVRDDVEIVCSGERGEVGIGSGDGEDAGAEAEGGDDGGGVADHATEPSFAFDLVDGDRTDQEHGLWNRSGHGCSLGAGRC